MGKLLNYVELFFSLTIFSLPFTFLPERYSFPFFGRSLPHIFLFFSLVFYIIYAIRHKKNHINHKGYFTIFFAWSFFCLVMGFISFPFYDHSIEEYLRNSKVMIIIYNFFPEFRESNSLLYVKLFLSYFWHMIKDFFFPFIGLYVIISGLYHEIGYKNLTKTFYRSVYGLAILMSVYSFFEIIWLWTGNDICAWILATINVQIYDPVSYNGWWPPLLWPGQLRSFCLEPSYFGIIANFLIPIIAVDIYKKPTIGKFILVLFMICMIFSTKSRTAILVYLGEISIISIFSVIFRYRDWKKIVLTIGMVTVGAFSIFFVGTSFSSSNQTSETIVMKYLDENIASVTEKDTRSNTARFGNSVALFRMGMNHPVTGVGMSLHSPYMKQYIPEFAKNDPEIKNWINDMNNKTFMESGIPVMNEYAAVLAWEGILGLFLFIIPPIVVITKLISGEKNFISICYLSIIMGELACLFSAEMFLTYPLALWWIYVIHEGKCKSWIRS